MLRLVDRVRPLRTPTVRGTRPLAARTLHTYRQHLSRLFAPTLKPESGPSLDTTSAGHRLLVRAGLIRVSSTGIYSLLPLGQRVLARLEALVDRTMGHHGGAHKLALPNLLAADLWKQTGRWETTGRELFRLTDRKATPYCLGPTHEEEITHLVAGDVSSYRQLPLRLYQVGRKFRDELRPRAGLLRAREFVMKDLYSFDADQSGALRTYNEVRELYRYFFKQIGLAFVEARADSGNIGGTLSHEFHYPSATGEDHVLTCSRCRYASNAECATGVVQPDAKSDLTTSPLSIALEEAWPLLLTFADGLHHGHVDHVLLATLTKLPFTVNVALVRGHDSGPTGADPHAATTRALVTVVHQDRSLNSHKLTPHLTDSEHDVTTYTLDQLAEALGSGPTSSSSQSDLTPANSLRTSLAHPLPCQLLIDGQLLSAGTQGTKLTDERLQGKAAGVVSVHGADLVQIQAGDLCPTCHAESPTPMASPIEAVTTIEVGHTFYLGTKYSQPLGALIRNTSAGTTTEGSPIEMGCYGIGLSRIVAAVADRNHDVRGIFWPPAIAPYRLCILPIVPRAKQIPASVSDPEGTVWRFVERLYDHLQTRSLIAPTTAATNVLGLEVDESTPGSVATEVPAEPFYWRDQVIIDDRTTLTPGQRFKDTELIGFPWVVVVGKQFLLHGEVELHIRHTNERRMVPAADLLSTLDSLERMHNLA
ncbi:hypothetical protein IWQ60_000035 [Tieghemiomyces parasiticus]|uniref:proline--tRNA ligase n=1 Tax=Tieghemiomyces parasiticus TaxID=78921 RepID=A0A9W8AM01_9FUNG|nr:hypothetical protein IWQ60_000035 [Tieghemiomyces parasiticus]